MRFYWNYLKNEDFSKKNKNYLKVIILNWLFHYSSRVIFKFSILIIDFILSSVCMCTIEVQIERSEYGVSIWTSWNEKTISVLFLWDCISDINKKKHTYIGYTIMTLSYWLACYLFNSISIKQHILTNTAIKKENLTLTNIQEIFIKEK